MSVHHDLYLKNSMTISILVEKYGELYTQSVVQILTACIKIGK